MKKIMSLLLVAAMVMPLAAKEKESPEQKANKDYSTWLPAKGDFSVGFAIDPLATFLGNMFNGNLNNGLGDLSGDPMLGDVVATSLYGCTNPMVSIMGTYMLNDKLAVRANIGMGITVKANNTYVQDDAALFFDPLSRAKVTDKRKLNRTFGSIALGVEYRVGKTRPVQGVFGAGVNYAFGQVTYNYSYGNAITEANQIPSIDPSLGYAAVAGYMPNARLLSSQADHLIHMLGVYGTVGIEWFVAPKIALGANVNVGLYYEVNPARADVYEGWNIQTMKVEKFTEKVAPASHGFHFGTDNIGANLYVAFYFNQNK
ncbi:MAG: hypothetical protein ACI30A_05910 [Paludibacteraceae bacterium]